MMSSCVSSSMSAEQGSHSLATNSRARVESQCLLKASSEQGSESPATDDRAHGESHHLSKALLSEEGSKSLATDRTFSKSSARTCDFVMVCCNIDSDETEVDSDEEKPVYCLKQAQTPLLTVNTCMDESSVIPVIPASSLTEKVDGALQASTVTENGKRQKLANSEESEYLFWSEDDESDSEGAEAARDDDPDWSPPPVNVSQKVMYMSWSSSTGDNNSGDVDKKADKKERKQKRQGQHRLEQESKRQSRLKKDLKCYHCDYVTKSRKVFNSHEMKVHDIRSSLRFACELCGKRFRTPSDLNYHCATIHGMDVMYDTFLCVNCGRDFVNQQTYTGHVRKCGRTGPLKCVYEGCNAVLGTVNSLQSHYMKVHLKRYIVECSYCKKKFYGNNRLKKHISGVHLKLKPFSCTEDGCNKKFATNGSLTVHLRTHSKIPYLSCHYCNYACRQRSALNWHMKKHPEALEESKAKRIKKHPEALEKSKTKRIKKHPESLEKSKTKEKNEETSRTFGGKRIK